MVDFDTPENNDWLAVNQFRVVENSERRPDVVLFINGLPLAVIELKNPTNEKATILTAFRQICTYKQEIPSLFTYNETIVISDGLEARIGSLTADQEWFLPWRTIEGEDEAPSTELELEVLIKGIFEKERFLSYLKHFVVFEETEGGDDCQKDCRLSPIPRRENGSRYHCGKHRVQQGISNAASYGIHKVRARA